MRNPSHVITLAVYLISCAAYPAHGDTGMETVVVTASRLGTAPDSLIDRAEIERLNPQTTTHLLRSLPNIIVSENGGAGGQTFVSIRGGEPNFTLVLVDGIAVNDPTNSRGGGFDFNQLDPTLIERVEVYRGGISAIHGGEAINGVIHFVTRAPATGLAVASGNEGQRQVAVSAAVELTESLSGLAAFSSNELRRSSLSSYRSQQALGKLMHDGESSHTALLLSLTNQTARALPEDSGGLRSPQRLAERRESRQILAGLRNDRRVSEHVEWTTSVSYSHHHEDAANPGIPDGVLSGIPASDIEADYRQYVAESFVTTRDVYGWDLLVGGSYRSAEGKNRGYLDYGIHIPAGFSLKQDTWSVFTEASGSWRDLNIAAGLRHDAPDTFDRETSLRLSFSHPLGQTAMLHSSFSEGYKLPSFFGLAHPIAGNPQLKPEKSANATLGVSIALRESSRFELNYFYSDFTDLVDFDPEQFLTVNRSSVIAQGMEFNSTIALTDWLRIDTDLTYLSTDIKGTSEQLRRRPRWSGGLAVQTLLKAAEVRLSLDSRGAFHDSSVLTGPLEMSGYTSVDLSVNYRVNPSLSLTFQAHNLFNSSIEEAIGFTDTGRLWRVGFRYGG